jgi:hypothetical protein
MRAIISKARLITSAIASSVLLLGASAAFAQTVSLTAGPASATLPDGQSVPMWGYTCGTGLGGATAGVVTVDSTGVITAIAVGGGGSGYTSAPSVTITDPTGTGAIATATVSGGAVTAINVTNGGASYTAPTVVLSGGGGIAASGGAACTAMNGVAQVPGTTWQPPLITVPYVGAGTSLTINLTNSLSFLNGNSVPTSLVIVGQIGGGLGSGFTTTPSPIHPPQGVTWFASAPPDSGTPATAGNATFTPPSQPDRVQSFATEVGATGATLTGKQVASGSALTWSNLRPGTYLIESGTHPSIQGPMGLYGVLVVTTAPVAGTSAGCAYPGATAGACALSYDADVPLLLSEIDAVQNTAVNTAVNTAGFSETRVWSGQPDGCGNPLTSTGTANPAFNTCYPPAVNYDPRYFLVNGKSFDRTNVAASTISTLNPAPTASLTGTVVLRLVNAGSRMHVPSIVNTTMALYAEDGNLLPGTPRKQNEVFLAAGKTHDVALQLATAGSAYNTPNAYPIYDRSLSLSTNSAHDGGMQAYLSVAGGAAPIGNLSPPPATVTKYFYCSSGQTLAVTDATKGLIGGVPGANGVTLGAATLPSGYSLSVNPDGTFTYVPPTTGACAGSFLYTINGTAAGTATIRECTGSGAARDSACAAAGTVTANADNYVSPVGAITGHPAVLHIAPPGVLINDTDTSGHALSVDLTAAPTCTGPSGSTCTLSLLADGSFTATMSATGSYTFSYKAKNSQGVLSLAAAAVTVGVPAASNIQVRLIDGVSNTPIPSQDYRWTIEEDRTFYVDPACQINSTDTTLRPSSCPPLPVQSLGYSFHTAFMPVVATGCTGPVSCEAGQTLLNTTAVACDQGNGVCRPATSKVSLDPGQIPLDPTKRYFLSVAPADGINPTINGAGGPVQDNLQCDPNTSNCPVHQFRTSGGTNNMGDCTGFTAAVAPTDNCGHSLGGIQISGATVAANSSSVPVVANQFNIVLTRTPLPTAQITAFVFEDDYPVNGEHDASGVAVSGPAPFEGGLGGFNIVLFDQAGGLGDATGQPTYDMFNQPLTNSLSGWIDPLTGFNACPLTRNADNLIGMIPVCPQFEDGNDATGNPVPSPLVGQAVINNLYPGLYEIQAFPGADRIAAGEEWLQTNTLDGAKPHEAFVKPAEPKWFQEFGPGGFHVSVGFANPKIINDRRAATGGPCETAGNCTRSLFGQVTGMHMARTPDQRTYSSGDGTMYAFTQCYVAISAPDSYDFAFAKCDADGKFEFSSANGNGPLPDGDYKLTVFDQWNDIMLDGLVNPVCVGTHSYTANNLVGGASVPCPGGLGTSASTPIVFPVTQWRTNLYTRTFIDTNGDGVSNVDGGGNPTEPGLALVNTNIRYRDGSFGFFNNTDLNGFAGWNEIFPFMNWLVAETTSTRFKQTGTHIVYDAGGPVDGETGGGSSTIADHLANTIERTSLPAALRVPGAVYCDLTATADCNNLSIATGPYGGGAASPTSSLSTGVIIPPQPFGPSMAFQSMLGQSVFMEFGMRPMTAGENGGIQGHVIYASTRPFDDPQLLLQLSWEPGVADVKVNLYQESTDSNGQPTLKLVDTTTTTSWDDFAQGFRRDASGNLISNTYTYTYGYDTSGNPLTRQATGKVPNMNCPGQDPTSPFFQTLYGSTQWLDQTSPKTPLAADALFKCYDGWSQLNQVQPAPYDGKYTFPSIVALDPTTGRPAGAGALNGTAGAVPGTNCTICTTNPNDGWPMLPNGKYVVEVIVPKGYELVKEEDKNILMGDIYVAPVTVQFPGVGGNIFIMPDQAAVGAAYNKNNPLNMTQDLGSKTLPRHEGDTGSIETYWPCVGALRTVPDFNSLFPGVGQNAPFAGAQRNLCDRKEVTLEDQSTALAKFYVFTPAHIAGHFTGTITNDFASEFDPFSPQFGEKFGPPNLPVGLRDYTGHEMVRVYSDQWGIYNGLYYSTWEVNPPNPTGYAPQMAIDCMNDPGPIPKRNALGQYVNAAGAVVATPDLAAQITDPSYNPAYSNFCYEQPFMPGFTTYMDTPVIPTQAFADGYNLPDSEYPDGTPAVDSVIGDVQGPWVSAAGRNIVIKCLGFTNGCNKNVQNPDFSGPGATAAPYNQKWISRHYGFGSGGTVTIGGVQATCSQWTDAQLTCAVPTISATLNTTTGVGSTCYNGTSTTIPAGQSPRPRNVSGTPLTNYRCGELVITKSDGKRSIDAVTVTVAGSRTTTPTVVTPSNTISGTFGAVLPNPIQTAIDAAQPGDLIIVAPGTYKERLIMWKPVRLQGAGPGSVIIDADAHPADALASWRRQLNCVFGLSVNGVPVSPDTHETSFDPNGTAKCPDSMFLTGDRQPFEPIVNYDNAGNANLAEVLIEPTLMGAYEGAGITVVGRGVRIPTNSNDFWGIQASLATGVAGAYPDGSVYLTNSTTNCATTTNTGTGRGRSYGTSNYKCNPSRIDGFSVTNSSQGGGGIFIHSWGHYIDVGNNRVYGNHGTLTGGISLGNGETPGAYANDGTICGNGVAAPAALCPPIPAGTLTNELIPLGLNINVRLHNNAVYNNASLGDALFSATPSGAGGVTVSAGADNYRVDHNWIAGNLSSSDGGGMAHSGQSYNGTIDHNFIVYNQSTNPTLPTSGGGLDVIGSNNPRLLNGTECGNTNDLDCPPGLGDGTGKALVIDSNLILGNSAESGTAGGVRLQQLNGTELTALPLRPDRWYDVTMKNNIIVNNVAGWDGGGMSMEDTLRATIVNNTIASNDTTASAGVLFKALGAANASSTPPDCTPTTDPTLPQNPNCLSPNAGHVPQPAGLAVQVNSVNMRDALNGVTVLCPTGYGYTGGTLGSLFNASCKVASIPVLTNDLFWQNRAFHVEIVGAGTTAGPSPTSQQNLVAMIPVLNQTSTGFCATSGLAANLTSTIPTYYWDVGVRGDVTPNDGAGLSYNGTPVRLSLNNSILTPITGVTYGGSGNRTPSTSPVLQQYCNGSRVAPENGGHGYLSPPGRAETTGLSTLFVFNGIQPAATVDEGNNWINLTYGPLTPTASCTTVPGTTCTAAQSAFSTAGTAMFAAAPTGPVNGAYSISSSSAAVNGGTNTATPSGVAIPTTDFFGNTRTAAADIGAVEFPAPTTALGVVNPASLSFAGTIVSTTSAAQTLTLSNIGGAALTGVTFTVATTSTGAGTFQRSGGTCATAAFTLNANASCTVLVTYTAPATAGANAAGTVTFNVGAGQAAVVNSPVSLTGSSAARTYTASIGPSPVDFGNWANGTTSSTLDVHVLNTGNSALTNFTYTLPAGTRFTRVSTGTFTIPNCPTTAAGTLAPGASCTIRYTFAPNAVATFSSTLTVGANGGSAATTAGFTPANVTLTGTGVATRATMSVTPNPLLITLATGTITNTGTVTLTNTATAGGSNVAVTGVAVANGAGGGFLIWFFNVNGGTDSCTGATLPPGGSCTVGVRFTNVLSPRGVTRAGTITFTDTGAPIAPSTTGQIGTLNGFATP